MIVLLLSLFIIVVIGWLAWWAINITEGVYLGRRVVIWLYDRYAERYDRVKNVSNAYDRATLATPLLAYTDSPTPHLLDVATGTGRLPIALAQHPVWNGQIIGLDLSKKMLEKAAVQLQDNLQNKDIYLFHAPAEVLPFEDEAFDIVACLEALEFMSQPKAILAELVRVLRPGGILLLTNRQDDEAKFFPGKTMANSAFQAMLEHDFDLSVIEVNPLWSKIYALVWACKDGERQAQKGELHDFWRCPRCQQTTMQAQALSWQCRHCQHSVTISDLGIFEIGG